MKQTIRILLVLAMSIGLTACRQEKPEETEPVKPEEKETTAAVETTEAVPEIPEICVIYAGNREEGFYNRLFRSGVEQAGEDFDVMIEEADGDSEEEWNALVAEACERGCDMIIASSIEIADAVAEAAASYPDICFAAVDAELEFPNVQSYVFLPEEGYFLAGAAAAMLIQETVEPGMEDKETEKPQTAEQPAAERTDVPAIGWISGMDISVIQGYYRAFSEGVHYVNPEIPVLHDQAGNWSDPETGRQLAEEMIGQGALVLMDMAGDTGAGILEAAEAYGVHVIGGAGGTREDPVFTTVIRRADRAAYLAIESMAEDTFSPETIRYLGLAEGGVSLGTFSDVKNSDGEPVAEKIEAQCGVIAEALLENLDKDSEPY